MPLETRGSEVLRLSDGKKYRNSRAVGNIGESIAMAEFVKRGIPVFTPFGQNSPVDMLVYINEKFVKIQVKTTEEIKKGKMIFDICRTNGFTGENKKYTKDEVDYFFLYCVENDFKGLISFEELSPRYTLCIRCDKAKNGQTKGINDIDTYQFDNRMKLLLEAE